MSCQRCFRAGPHCRCPNGPMPTTDERTRIEDDTARRIAEWLRETDYAHRFGREEACDAIERGQWRK